MVGLGNPGPRYAATRHNVGFLAVDALVGRLSARSVSTSAPADVWRVRLPADSVGADVLFIKPRTWMNRSGDAIRGLQSETAIAADEILLLVDDIYLPFGRLRLRASGTDGGHNGLTSVEEALGTRLYPRLRVGVGPVPEGVDYRDFVLEEFAGAEAEAWPVFLARIVDVVLAVLSRGVSAAQVAVAAANKDMTDRIDANKGVADA